MAFICTLPPPHMYVIENKQLIQFIKALIREIKFNGIFAVEFIVDEQGKFYFLEINLRNHLFGYASTFGGFNLPYQWALATIKGKIEGKINYESDTNFTVMAASYDINYIQSNQVNAIQWLWQYLTVDCLLDQDKRSPWFVYALYRAFCMGFIKMWFKQMVNIHKKIDVYPWL